MKTFCNFALSVLATGYLMFSITSCSNDDIINDVINNEEETKEVVIDPLPTENSEIVSFFEKEIQSFFDFDSETKMLKENKIHVFNSYQDLSLVYSGNDALPEIDFEKCTLIVAGLHDQVNKIASSISLISSNDAYILKIDIKVPIWHWGELDDTFFWKMYPKLEEKQIYTEINTIDLDRD